MPTEPHSRPLDRLEFDNRFVTDLPGDPEPANFRRQVLGASFSRVKPTRVRAPKLVAFSREAAALIDLTEETCRSRPFAELFVGNRLLEQMAPYAMCYGGHQFGNWAGQLGDGRAINLGEVINRRGERWILQLKGAGPTPYSRQADGLAVLRSSLREFLCSEAMHHLGVPTTRALSLITTGEPVERDMFYDGHPKDEPGAVVCRMSPSFLRFGNYELPAARGDLALLRRLVDYTIRVDFPHLGEPSVAAYRHWFDEICRTTAALMVEWLRVGFVHGVMNTDNMSVLGLTIDYGPYGWLEGYEPGWTPNTTDFQGRRYCFANQPRIAGWNLLRLANAIYPLVGEAEPFQQALDGYNDRFLTGWNRMMAEKLGLSRFVAETDQTLIGDLLELLQRTETDMTLFFRNLSAIDAAGQPDGDAPPPAALMAAYYQPEQLDGAYLIRLNRWLRAYLTRLQQDPLPATERRQRMNRNNPKYVLRNYLAQQAIDKAEQGDFSLVEELLEVMRHPYDEQPDKEQFAAKRPEWARHRAGCSMLS